METHQKEPLFIFYPDLASFPYAGLRTGRITRKIHFVDKGKDSSNDPQSPQIEFFGGIFESKNLPKGMTSK